MFTPVWWKMPSKAYLIISGSKFYLEYHSVVAVWKGLFSTGSYPCTRRTPLVNLGFFLQALSPAGPFFKISFCALPALPQACRPLMLLTMKNTWSLCKLCSSFSPPTLPGITPPHVSYTHWGEHPAPHIACSGTSGFSTLLPFPHTFKAPSLSCFHCSSQSPLLRNRKFQEGGNIFTTGTLTFFCHL